MLDPGYLFAVATRTNAAHAALGTELLGVEPHGATIRVLWRPDLGGGDPGTWANGVVSSLLDHACSLAALVSLGDLRRYGGTIGLRIDYPGGGGAAPVLIARAVCEAPAGSVLRVNGQVFAPGASPDPVAVGLCTIALNPVVHDVGAT